MKKLLAVGLLVLGLFCLLTTSSFAAYLGTSEWGKYYYEFGEQGVSKNGISYQVLLVEIFLNDAGRQGFHTNAYAVKALYLIDCAGNYYASAGMSYFDSSRNLIGEPELYKDFTWYPIIAGSIADSMKRVCCRGQTSMNKGVTGAISY